MQFIPVFYMCCLSSHTFGASESQLAAGCSWQVVECSCHHTGDNTSRTSLAAAFVDFGSSSTDK